eukprot:CAMPEP_0172364846 /NCGR_PEP_ID=MMETSP1060-20121228/7885_1 /TAXON_ID=37318 /ORGANISM="Pseudo-nitzschia pungens, Strain cf. cingulata" /LENGTH=313 /DNA_ID=CAMNT_0013087947 /DNA_START=335 /DNA_END=1273 /DNA_ORIENTATION=-
MRSTTVCYWKKAISYFFETEMPWCEQTQRGNPTRSTKINQLIMAIGHKECKGNGKDSSADHGFTKGEYFQILDMLKGHSIAHLRHQAMVKFQLHLIARGDDCSHVKKKCLEQNLMYPEYLTAQMRWSKNVKEEKHAPKQCLLGAMDTRFCVLLSLAIFQEVWHTEGGGSISQWLFADGTTTGADPEDVQDKEANETKSTYQQVISGAVHSDFFCPEGDMALGTHSVKKMGATMARVCGAHRDDVDYRARWRTKAMQDRYTDIQLDWPDVNAASRLCQKGVCLYKSKDDSGLTDKWLASTVAPGIRAAFGNGVA